MTGAETLTEFLTIHHLNSLFVLLRFLVSKHAFKDVLAGLLI